MGDKTAHPALIVIFGITGDLAKRKLMPALYHLTRDNLLHPATQIVGVTRQDISKTDVLAPLDRYTASHSRPSPTALRHFKEHFHLVKANMTSVEGYKDLRTFMDKLESKKDITYQRIFYLSIPPSVFDEVVGLMSQAQLNKPFKDGPKPSVLIEKPFGYDLESAKELIRSTREHFEEAQVYRIDHYLAKEMAQNILDFRFDNPLFASVWGRRYISRVEISATEKIGIENRVEFYEQTGALRDLIQSHLLQLLTLAATERPESIRSSESIHRERLRVLESIKIPKPNEVARMSVRGQYDGYKKDVDNKDSQIETFAAVQLIIDNDRWENVPFILKTGKALAEKSTKIDLYFGEGERQNRLTMQLQPNEGVYLELRVKRPGHEYQIDRVQMDFGYQRSFPGLTTPEAYERVLLDAIRQDQSLFASSDEVLCSWRIVEPILHEWAKSDTGLLPYKPGSSGPAVDF